MTPEVKAKCRAIYHQLIGMDAATAWYNRACTELAIYGEVLTPPPTAFDMAALADKAKIPDAPN